MTLQLPYASLRYAIASGINWDAGMGHKVALLDNTYVFDSAHFYFSEVNAAEVVGVGYTAGGIDVPFPYVSDEPPWTAYRSDDPTWTAPTTITARYAIFYKDVGGDPSMSPVYMCVDAEGDVVSVGTDFVVPIAADGLWRLGLETEVGP